MYLAENSAWIHQEIKKFKYRNVWTQITPKFKISTIKLQVIQTSFYKTNK